MYVSPTKPTGVSKNIRTKNTSATPVFNKKVNDKNMKDLFSNEYVP